MGTITVNNLGKAYKQYPTRWARLAEWVNPRNQPHHHLHWVLQGINFTVQAGEAVGIIGINGAGKSTLLKMIVGTTQPSSGSVHITGRVAALLELGMGFHPDFTGRQNAYMAGQLLGYRVEEIARLMPEIESFAEIGEYLDQPVRVYSSGMQMRLAFSVATAIRPDVLIVDEALSVGDAYFQHKSFDRIREFGRLGTTLLIVSHDKNAILSICDRAILLNAGQLAMQGEPEAVLDYYNALLADRQGQGVQQSTTPAGKVQTVSGSGEVQLASIALLDAAGQALEQVAVGQPVTLRIVARCTTPVPALVVGYMIKDRLGQAVFGTNTHHMQRVLHDLPAGQAIEFAFDFAANFGPGNYSIAVACHASAAHTSKNYIWLDHALVFGVVNTQQPEFVGLAWVPPVLRCSL